LIGDKGASSSIIIIIIIIRKQTTSSNCEKKQMFAVLNARITQVCLHQSRAERADIFCSNPSFFSSTSVTQFLLVWCAGGGV
jgi:hypothetical protein